MRKTLEKFIEDAREIHGDKYDYSKVVYKNAITPVTIKCPIHGDFNMCPHNHVGSHGQGCPLCGDMKKGDYQRGNTEKFIEAARRAHGDKYDYSKVDYYNNRQKVCIICPEHGEFWQQPIDHIHAHGCPECGKTLDMSEKFVLEALRKEFPDVVYQYRPEWLGNITSRQSLDFYLPEHEIGIEYHGRQHFVPIKKFGGEEGFEKLWERDLRKLKKCGENGVKLYYISFEKEIPEKYHLPVHRSVDELINAIKQEIEMRSELRENDERQSDIVSMFLDKELYTEENGVTDFVRVNEKGEQVKGVDVRFTMNGVPHVCDEKAAVHYMNRNLQTFAFELSFISRNDSVMNGWLIDEKKINDTFLCVWLDKVENGLQDIGDIKDCEVALVLRKRILEELESLGWTEGRLLKKAEKMRYNWNEPCGDVNENGCRFFCSRKLAEKPVNVLLSREKIKEISLFTKRIVKS